ncbi:MAG: DHA2 family efflux MFS transporter permease subunit [Paludibacter sp.]|nr:DHA2 family efflux MFS transporter permease subunit [Paludibacter sp.]
MLGTFMAVLDSTIVNVSLPKIMSSFGVGLSSIEWVITAYMLAMASMLPTSGWLADKFGYKRVYFTGLLLFTIGSLLCGMSTNITMLVCSRIIQGIGGGTVQPLGMAIITREFPPRQRGVALGFWSIASAASVSFGPLIGGYLVDNFTWKLIFDVNVPIGIIALALTFVIQREYRNNNTRKFDFVGFISAIIFLPVLLYALSEGTAATNSEGWHAPYILACFAVSAVAFTVFITQELTTKDPLLDLRLLKNHNFAMANILMFVFSMGMFGSTFLLPLYLQTALGYTATQSGAVFLPVGIIQGAIAPLSGIMSDKTNPKIIALFGLVLFTISFTMNTNLSFMTEHHYIMTSLYIRGFGMGMIFTPLNSISLAMMPRVKMAQASGISNTVRQIAGSLGVAILTTLLTSRTTFHSQIYGSAMSANSDSYKNAIRGLVYNIQHFGGSSQAIATQQAHSELLSNVSNQAFISGVNDDFMVATIIAAIGFIPIFFMWSKKKINRKIETGEIKLD